MAGMCRPSPLIFLLLLLHVASTYGGPWSKLVPAAIASSSSSAETMEMIPQLRIELSIENCTENGKFPIPVSCEAFYQCDDWDGLGMEMYQFTCPVGTIFDDHVSTCNFPSLVKSRPDCTSGEVQGNTVEEAINFSIVHAGYEMESVDLATGNDYAVRELMLNTIRDRTKRSAIIEYDYFTEESNVTEEIDFTEKDNITVECKSNIIEHNIPEEATNFTASDIVATKALGSCKHVYYVDQYVDMVTSMIPVVYPDFLRNVFKDPAVDSYNKILEAAQNHTNIWRNGDDIMSGFRRTYELAKLFGPSFQRKYKIAQRRLETLENSSDDIELEEEVREDIKYILEDLNDIRVTLREDSSERTYKRYEPRIKRKERQLEEKRARLREIMGAVKDLDEIISFLEFVKNDAGKIQQSANMTMQKLKIFRVNTSKDKTAFNSSIALTKNSIDAAMKQLETTLEEVENYKKRKIEAENYRKEIRDQIRITEAKIDEEVEALKKLTQEHQKRLKSASKMASVGAGLSFIPIVGAFIGSGLMASSKESVADLPEAMRLQQLQFDKVTAIHMNQSALKHTSLDATTQRIFDLEDMILSKGSEVRNLGYVEYYLLTVIEESEKILPYIARAISSLKDLERTFENVVFRLTSLITKAREVQEPAEKRLFKALFYADMSTMQTDWNNSYSDIIDIGSCTDPAYYNALVELIKATEPPISTFSGTEELNCTTAVIEPITINDTTITPKTPPIITTTTEQSLLYMDYYDLDAENFV